MAYDPDGDPDAFDPTDLDDLDAYLEHPNTKATDEDLARAFRALPPSEQIEELTPELLAMMLRRNEVADLLADDATSPEMRPGLRRLYDALQGHVRQYAARITELGGTPPEDPGPRVEPL